MVPFAKPSVVELSTRIGVGGCGCPSSWRVVRIGTASWPFLKSGTDFSLSGGRHHVVKDLGYGMYRSVKRGYHERWLGRVSGVVAKEIVSTDAAASAGI